LGRKLPDWYGLQRARGHEGKRRDIHIDNQARIKRGIGGKSLGVRGSDQQQK
jgi:hypothetical protein